MIFAAIAAVVLLFGFVAFTGAPYVPSRRRDLQKAFDELYRLKKTDMLVDIGSGDGVVLREASRRGARAIGYELQPLLVLISRWLSRHDEKVSVRVAISSVRANWYSASRLCMVTTGRLRRRASSSGVIRLSGAGCRPCRRARWQRCAGYRRVRSLPAVVDYSAPECGCRGRRC